MGSQIFFCNIKPKRLIFEILFNSCGSCGYLQHTYFLSGFFIAYQNFSHMVTYNTPTTAFKQSSWAHLKVCLTFAHLHLR